MTRDEERQQAADNYVGHPQEVGEDLYINTSRKSFKNGAEWSDEHPNPELKKQWIDKACDWLEWICSVCVVRDTRTGTIISQNNLIYQFEKAMEEQR